MIILDTSSLVRLFSNDIPEKVTIVKKILQSDEIIKIPDVVFTELDMSDCLIIATSFNHEFLSFDEEMLKIKKSFK